MTLLGVPATTDPLQHVEPESPTYDFCFRNSDSEHGCEQETPILLNIERRTAVLHWSTEEVKVWMRQNVPFGNGKMQECSRAFTAKGIDGLSLLTLQRTHPACIGMSDFDWLLFKASRKRLLSGCGTAGSIYEGKEPNYKFSPSFWTPPCTPRRADTEITPPDSPQSFRLGSNSSTANKQSQETLKLSAPKKLFAFPKLTWTSDTAKDEQIEMLTAEVKSLRGEVVSAEERATTLQAQMHHLDEVLRTSILAGYLHTRTRWSPLVGEPIIEDSLNDDWLPRFLVLQGSSIYFYLHATDLRPQGTIPIDDIIDSGPLQSHMQYPGDDGHWYSFHITTCHGLILECSTQLKLQMDTWLNFLGD